MKTIITALLSLLTFQVFATELILSHESILIENTNNYKTVSCQTVKYKAEDLVEGHRGDVCHTANLPVCGIDRVIHLEVNGESADLHPGERVQVKCIE